MSSIIKKEILKFLEKIETNEEPDVIQTFFHKAVSALLKNVADYYGIIIDNDFSFEIRVEDIDEENCTDIGLKFRDNILILSKWALDSATRTRKFFLYFFLIKSCFLIIFKRKFSDFDQSLINILSYLFIKEIEKISSISNVLFIRINSKIFPDEIANSSYQLWQSLLNLLFSMDIPSKSLFDYYSNVDDPSSEKRVSSFSNWVTNLTVKIDDVIAPIYINWKLINVLDQLLKYGFEGGTTKQISRNLEVNQSTVRKYFEGLTSTFYTFWRAVFNFQKLNLHNYYVKVSLKETKNIDIIADKISENPYLKSLFSGETEQSTILYSATLLCPHTSSDNLARLLSRYKDKNLIDDYSIQLVRRKIHYGTVTSYPYKNTIENFNSFVNGEQENLRKYLFADEKRDFSTEFEYYSESLDYNLLYFLSLLKGRYLVRANYTVWVNELSKLYEKNKLSDSIISEKMDFLNQIEIRARRRDLLSYSLFMLNFNRRGSDILNVEIPLLDFSKEKEINDIIEQLRVFSFFGQMNVYDSIILTIPGANAQHPIRNTIETLFNKSGIFPTFYTIKIMKSKFIPYHELYDYDKESWKVY